MSDKTDGDFCVNLQLMRLDGRVRIIGLSDSVPGLFLACEAGEEGPMLADLIPAVETLLDENCKTYRGYGPCR